MRGARYFRDHYRRGLRMLMKNHRKSLSKSRVVNAVTNNQRLAEALSKLVTNGQNGNFL